ncbi:DMT family transporter [Anaerosacchariphilus polymeriproducens]|uniref:DMT family transporter n=1 Tax=Anaerosacchariphilus polymeriproducens TaxID=1812858 RepID=A0A371AY76_9FIRM|nr:DMT family transporter [Anaerosacchariphilus polymeriproducens]RDU24507.1 DMT family transporter [Anaerosacchariphilus polymeriproducens]
MKVIERNNESKDIILELVAIAFLATGGIFVKLSPLSPINTGFYRVLFSIPLLFPMAYKNLKYLTKKDILILFLAGCFLAGDVALWNLSFSYTSVANANLLTNLTPFTVIPISYFLFKEKIPKFFFVGTIITLFGIYILLGGKVSPNPSNYFGDFLALCASLFYASFLLISYRLRDRIESSVIMFVSGFGSALTLFITAFFVEGNQIPHSLDQLWPLIGLTICLQVIGHNLLAHCQGKINVNLSAIICLTQPAIASVYSFFIFSEVISVKEVCGILIVMLGVYLVKAQYKKNTHLKQKKKAAIQKC